MITAAKSNGKHQFLPWIIWGIAASYFFFDYLQQMVPGVIGPSLIDSFHVDAAALGTLSAFYFYSYSVMQIPVGLISDHFGPHRPLVIAALVAVGGSILFAMSETLALAELSRMLIGAGAAFAYVSCLKLVSNWFPGTRFATMAGLTSMVGMTGAIVGGAPLADAVTLLGWRETSEVFAAVGGVLAVLIWLVIRDHPPEAARWEDHPEHSRGKSKTSNDLKHILSRSRSWITGVYTTTMNITFTALGAVWGTSFIQKAYSIEEVDAAAAVSMLFLGGLVGGIFWGWLSDHIRRRKLPMICAASGALVVMVIILYTPGVQQLPLPFTYAFLMLQGFCCNGLILGYALGNDIRPPGSAGVSLGFVNTCTAGGTAIFLPIIGWLSDVKSPERAAQGISALSVEDFRFALTFLVVCLAVALLAALLSRETNCKLLYDKD